jgi:glycine/serine hydroxymethyltransferase
MRVTEMKTIGAWMLEALKHPDDAAVQSRIRGQVSELCAHFPAPSLPI